jgi:hypothetical protein
MQHISALSSIRYGIAAQITFAEGRGGENHAMLLCSCLPPLQYHIPQHCVMLHYNFNQLVFRAARRSQMFLRARAPPPRCVFRMAQVIIGCNL